MKSVVFAYHNMGVLGLAKLLQHGFDIPLVFTHVNDPKENVWFASVIDFCEKHSIPWAAPDTPNNPEVIAKIRAHHPDILFSFYYRYMIASGILEIPPLGAYNLHGSLLPAYRGRCPVNWVIINGEQHTGVTLHEMVEKPDAGAIVAQEEVDIRRDDTPVLLYAKLEKAAGEMLDNVLPEIKQGNMRKTPQDLSKGSYFGGRRPEDGRIDWNLPALAIYNLIRGVTKPYPGAFCFLADMKVIFWWAHEAQDRQLNAGRIVCSDEKAIIGAGAGYIEPIEIEVGGKELKGNTMIEFFKKHEGELLQ
ncbi:MAG: formyltransferase [Deltaproteobacteria bacterium]|nr:formyltransferase [Deltaproteobacteria bacterium]